MGAQRVNNRHQRRARRSRTTSSTNASQCVGAVIDETLNVERLVARGLGLARLKDGRVALIRGAFPGDTLRPLRWRAHRSHIEISDFKLEIPAPARRRSPCPYAARCGGCDLMPLELGAQRAAKRQLLEDVLRRTAKLEPRTLPVVWRQPGESTHYRSRIRVHLSRDGQLGFYSPASHQLVDVERCLVATETVNTWLSRLRQLLARHPRWFEPVLELELRALAARPELTLYPRPAATPRQLRTTLLNLREALADAAVAWTSDTGSGDVAFPQPVWLTDSVHAYLAPGAFSQVNWEVNRAIIMELLAGVTERKIRTFADLYCGAGNFALPLLAQGMAGRGVESNPVAVALANQAAAAQGLHGRFEVQRAEQALASWADRGDSFDLIIIDPPRAGLGSMVTTLASIAHGYLFICACDPVPFARDLRQLLDLGFTLQRLFVYEMFPQTHHFEVVAWMATPSAR